MRAKESVVRAVASCVVATLLAFLIGASASATQAVGMKVDGTVLSIRLIDGRIASGRQLSGATLSLAADGTRSQKRVLIASVQPDPTDPQHEILLYHMLVVGANAGRTELCSADAQGQRWSFPFRDNGIATAAISRTTDLPSPARAVRKASAYDSDTSPGERRRVEWISLRTIKRAFD